MYMWHQASTLQVQELRSLYGLSASPVCYNHDDTGPQNEPVLLAEPDAQQPKSTLLGAAAYIFWKDSPFEKRYLVFEANRLNQASLCSDEKYYMQREDLILCYTGDYKPLHPYITPLCGGLCMARSEHLLDDVAERISSDTPGVLFTTVCMA